MVRCGYGRKGDFRKTVGEQDGRRAPCYRSARSGTAFDRVWHSGGEQAFMPAELAFALAAIQEGSRVGERRQVPGMAAQSS